MKVLTYILTLLLSGFIYLLFAAYMGVSAGLSSMGPLISTGIALILFGFLSWFHFYKPRLGAFLLTLGIIGMYFTWPFQLLIEYFKGSEYVPSPFEFLPPLFLSLLIIFFAWKAPKSSLNKGAKLALSIPPVILVLYVATIIFNNLYG